MKTVVVDTNVIIDIIRGDAVLPQLIGQFDRVLVPLVVLGELHAGFSETRADRAKRKAVERFLAVPSVQTATLTEETVGCYASIHRQLKKAGTPIPQNDVWIAAVAMEHGAVLCSRDRDFRAVANLRIIPED